MSRDNAACHVTLDTRPSLVFQRATLKNREIGPGDEAMATPHEVHEYFRSSKDQYEQEMKCEVEKERWKSRSLYRSNTKAELERICRKLRIPVTSSVLKHQLISLAAQENGEKLLDNNYVSYYSVNLDEIPTSTFKINNSLSLPYIRSVLKFHNLPVTGMKDQVVMRVYHLRHNKTAAVTVREEKQIGDLVNLIYKAILEQRHLNVTTDVYRQRNPHFIRLPPLVSKEEDLQTLFSPLPSYLDSERKKQEKNDFISVFRPHVIYVVATTHDDMLKNRITQTGAKIKVRWTKQEPNHQDGRQDSMWHL